MVKDDALYIDDDVLAHRWTEALSFQKSAYPSLGDKKNIVAMTSMAALLTFEDQFFSEIVPLNPRRQCMRKVYRHIF